MIELAMAVCLTVMGIYFIKSTDLPKELKDRSTQMKAETGHVTSVQPKKMIFPKVHISNEKSDAKLVEMKIQKKAAELKIQNEIDKLTLTITTLEQEIRANNERNQEIQTMIDAHLVSLEQLQAQINSLV